MSKHADGSVYCDFISCHLVIHPRDNGAVRGLQLQFHGHCWLKLQRDQKNARENPRPQFVTALLLALLFVIANNANAQEVKGCYFTYYAQDGQIRFEPFLKIADKEHDSEDGEREIWGFKPLSDSAKDEAGRSLRVNVLASRFLPLGKSGPIPTGSTERHVRCPSGYW